MPTADDFYKWMKEFHPGIVLVSFQEQVVDTYFRESLVAKPLALLIGKTFIREKITKFEEYWKINDLNSKD